MITPRISLMENEINQGVLLIEGHDVRITREDMDALGELIDPNGKTGPWQDARDLLEWSNETGCESCTGMRPVVTRDRRGRPMCSDCHDAAVEASKQARSRFAEFLS